MIRVKRKVDKSTVKTYGRVMRGEITNETETKFTVKPVWYMNSVYSFNKDYFYYEEVKRKSTPITKEK